MAQRFAPAGGRTSVGVSDACVPLISLSYPSHVPRRLGGESGRGTRDRLSEASAPAFWALAEAEGNEACITTWQGRDG